MTAKIDWYREVLELEPNSKVFFPLARLLAGEGQISEAVSILEHGLNRHPEFLEARLCLIEILFKNSMKEKCEAEIAKLNKVFTSYAGFWHAWAACLASDQAQADTASLLRFLAAQFVAGPLQLHEVLNKGLDVIMREGKAGAAAEDAAGTHAQTVHEPAPEAEPAGETVVEAEPACEIAVEAEAVDEPAPEVVESSAAAAEDAVAEETPLAAFEAHTEDMLNDLDAELEQSKAVAEAVSSGEETPLQEPVAETAPESFETVAEMAAAEDAIEEAIPAGPTETANFAAEEPQAADSMDAAESGDAAQSLPAEAIEEPVAEAEPMAAMQQNAPEAALPEVEPEVTVLPAVEETAQEAVVDEAEEEIIQADMDQAMGEAAFEEALPQAPAEEPAELPVVEDAVPAMPEAHEEPAAAVDEPLPEPRSPDMVEDSAAATQAVEPDLEELSLPEPPAEELPAVEETDLPVAEAGQSMEAEPQPAAAPAMQSGETIVQAAERAEKALVEGLDLPDMEPSAEASGDDEPLLDEFAEEEPFSLRTRSMAEVLAEQGDLKGALDIYQELAAQATSADELTDINQRVATLKSRLEMANASAGFQARDDASQAKSKEKLLSMLEALAQRVEARAQ